jgi:BlaI family transcriptional regulator, penicillinase repressor
MARPKYARPTDAELQILAILWRRGGCTVRQVFNELKLLRGSGYNSSLKLVQIMHEKGYVKRDDSRRPQVYTAVMREAATKKLLIQDLINRVFGSGTTLVVDTLRAQRLSKTELAQIRGTLNEQRARR